MALEKQIIEWSATRPEWQRFILRKVATGAVLSDEDFDQLVDEIIAPSVAEEVSFGLEHLPKAEAQDPPVRLMSIAKPEHVNALASDRPLTFEPNGLTIVYGDNGSGKSGYARLLKRITRTRHQEEVLSDVFRDTSLEKPTADLSVRIGDKDVTLSWPDTTLSELQRMLFYDGACGSAYIATESDFPYRPSALFVMDGLIDACVAVRSRIDAKLDENARTAATLPVVSAEAKHTEAGRFLDRLSGTSQIDTLDSLITRFGESKETIDELKETEARLRSTNAIRERQTLKRQVERLLALRNHLEKVNECCGDDRLIAIQQRRDDINSLQQAIRLLVEPFESEPFPGVGGEAWRLLWQSARRFSEELAYPVKEFPVVDSDARCVLCQQVLDEEGRVRLSRLDRFVKDETQVRLDAAREVYELDLQRFRSQEIWTEAAMSNLKDLEVSHFELMAEVKALLDGYQVARASARTSLENGARISPCGFEPASTLARLAEAAKAPSEMAESFSDHQIVQERLATATSKRQEAELLQHIYDSRAAIVKEIVRLKEREVLEAAKTGAATGPITKKILELSEESITEVVRDTFTRETDRLRLERVTLARTRAEKGALLHQPKLVGVRQEVKLPRVFSEGERTALGLAALFTEAQLDASKSALILDDPVTSLDHIRRGLVAARLAVFAESRQVIMFTHDVAFVADLRREANGRGVPVAERSVARSRADERKPGVCGIAHPWKAKDVPARLDELRKDLARIKKDSDMWDQQAYEDTVAIWAGKLSETWERIFSQEIVSSILAEGGLEVRPMMVKVLARFSDTDHKEFDGSYSRISQWAKRHDKSAVVNYVAPEVGALDNELELVATWFKRVKGYKN